MNMIIKVWYEKEARNNAESTAHCAETVVYETVNRT